MGVFEHFPFTDYHSLNLDWVLEKVKALGVKVDSFENKSLPPAGTTGQTLTKLSDADYDYTWATIPAGPQGPVGPTGPQGIQGPTGPQGPKGDSGASFVVKGLYATLSDLQTAHPTGSAGDAYAVGTDASNVVYLWDVDTSAWTNVGSIQGPQGATGPQGAQGPAGANGVGVPAGGSTGQVLAKSSGADYATTWVSAAGGGGDTMTIVLPFANNSSLTELTSDIALTFDSYINLQDINAVEVETYSNAKFNQDVTPENLSIGTFFITKEDDTDVSAQATFEIPVYGGDVLSFGSTRKHLYCGGYRADSNIYGNKATLSEGTYTNALQYDAGYQTVNAETRISPLLGTNINIKGVKFKLQAQTPVSTYKVRQLFVKLTFFKNHISE